MKRENPSLAFTLIELLIVVAIIGILAAIAVPNFLNAMTRSKLARVQAEERAMAEAYVMYKLDNNGWPPHDHTWMQHHWVTTPIAYLTTSIQDIFAQSETAKNDPVWTHHKGLYHFEPSFYWFYEWPNAVKSDVNYFQSHRNSAFFVVSFGPDQDFDQNTNTPGVYEASNGLISNGDVLYAVPDTFRQGYPFTEGNAIFNY